jgi:hypothetical protein
MTEHVPTLEEVLYYADFWLTLADKVMKVVDREENSGETKAIALAAVKLAYSRYRKSLELYTRIENPPDNVGALAAQLQSEVDAMMEI